MSYPPVKNLFMKNVSLQNISSKAKVVLTGFISIALLSGCSETDSSADQTTNDNTIAQAVASASRSEEHTARDANRSPAEVLALSGIKEGDTVIEFAGIGQYYTTMLSDIVGPEGEVHIYDLPYTERFGGETARAFVEAHPNTTYHQEDYNGAEFPSEVDVVFNVLYYHDLQPNEIDIPLLNDKLLTALKPGGRFLVIDHKAEDGSGWRDAGTIHRMETDVIKQEVMAAGFELEIDSDLLAHPEDDRKQMVFGETIRGVTDRALFVFRKPE